jgi:phosphatidate cytidylyltransferase
MSSIIARILTILIAVPLVLVVLWAGKEFDLDWAILVLIGAVSAVAAWEFSELASKLSAKLGHLFIAFSSAIALFVGFFGVNFDSALMALATLIWIVLIIVARVLLMRGKASFGLYGWVFGLFYCGFLLSFLFRIYEPADGFYLLTWLLALVWGFDMGAFVTGKLIGKHKLAPSISPNKTWEGVVGGFVFAFIAGLLSQLWVPLNLESSALLLHSLALAVIVTFFGQLGDLLESRMKRMAGLKDSGNLFPGHGGLLDRIDALLLVTPFFYFYLVFVLQII